MLTLDYRLSPVWRAQAHQLDLRSASAEALHYDLFLGDVVFRSNEADFSAPWDWVPVLDFAMSLLRIARELHSSASQCFEFTESEATLDFERKGDEVRISASYSPSSAVVAHQDLLRTCEEFARRVVEQLAAEFPEVTEAPAFRLCQREVLSPPEPTAIL